MSTVRQKKLARNIIENLQSAEPETMKDIIISSGYSPISADSSSHVIMNQKGLKEELEVLGFNPKAAKKVVADILHNGEEESSRLKAADMVFKVHGTYAPEKSVNLDVVVDGNDMKSHESLRLKYEAELKQSLLSNES